jgi:hypothetical protein
MKSMDPGDVVHRGYGIRGAVRSRPGVPLAIALVLAGTLLGCTSVPVSAGHRQSPGTVSPPVRHTARTVIAGGSPAIGKAYPFKLFIHCGVPVVGFSGRSWQPVAPVPKYPGPRPVNGITTYTGYVPGTMTLVNARILRFVADNSAVASPFSVVFEPRTARVPRAVCA